MRIAQVAPLVESVPPRRYGGTERVVSWLTEELLRQGHEVTLFASGDSQTSARLEAVCRQAIRLDPDPPDPLISHFVELADAFGQADRFDVLHCHVDYLAFPFARDCPTPSLHTLHGRLDVPHWRRLAETYPEIPLVSISDDQRRPLRDMGLNWAGTVHHGLPASAFVPGKGRGNYLAYVSRFSPEKRPEVAIEVAKRAGIRLIMAGKVDEADRDYFEQTVRPRLDHPLIEFLGEVDEEEKHELLGDATAVIFPLDWPEPFGLVMIEAMARGTPVIARPRGAVTEVVRDGVTGILAKTVDEMVAAVKRIGRLDRGRCRRLAQREFSAATMARRYEALYWQALQGRAQAAVGARPGRDRDRKSGWSA